MEWCPSSSKEADFNGKCSIAGLQFCFKAADVAISPTHCCKVRQPNLLGWTFIDVLHFLIAPHGAFMLEDV